MSKNLEIKIPKTLNEHIVGKCNMDYPDEAPEVVGTVSTTYAKAIKDRKDTEKKLQDDFKEQDKITKEFVKKNTGIDMKESVQLMESNNNIKKCAYDALGTLSLLLTEITNGSDEYVCISDNDIKTINDAYDIVCDIIYMIENNDIEESMTEATAVAEPKTKQKRERENPEDLLGNQLEDENDILYMRVYDELSAEVSGLNDPDVQRRLKAKRGERYLKVVPCADGIKVWEDSPEKFEFAKKVADTYGVKTYGPTKETIPLSSYYKYSMTFVIPS